MMSNARPLCAKRAELIWDVTMSEQHTKSKDRVQTLGEVFTPKKTVDEMLNMLDCDWSKEGLTFFEPTCGTGNFVIEIVKRRSVALYERYVREGKQFAELRSITEACLSVWAIDVDEQNILECRYRVYEYCKEFLERHVSKLENGQREAVLYLQSIVMVIADRIFQNEALTALSPNIEAAKLASQKTKMSQLWFEKEGYVPMPFTFKRSPVHPKGIEDLL